MSNPNNLIRPSRLGANNMPPPIPEEGAEIPQINPNQLPPNIQNDLSGYINRVVAEAMQLQGRQIFHSFMNLASDINNEVDIPINIGDNRDLSDMDKIPDVVKSLRQFSGEAGEFSSWKKSVDRILRIYEHLKGTPKYYGILSVIRNKIVGYADVALESYNTPLNWEKISKCLTLHYADKRDLGTLEYQLTTLVQGTNNIPEFYQLVYHHLSLILNKLSAMDLGQESMNVMTQAYRDKALDTFVRGLKGDLPKLLSVREPADLPQALHLCLKLQNMDYRTQHANNSQGLARKPHFSNSPPVPPRRNMNSHPQPVPAPRQGFYPELVHNPQSFNSNGRMNWQPLQQQLPFPNARLHQNPSYNLQMRRPQYHNPQPLPPKPQPRPEPMDVDRSIRSMAVNYQNRPRNIPPIVAPKRNVPQQDHGPNKLQRTFYTEQTDETDPTLTDYKENMDKEDDNYEQSIADYTEGLDEPEHLDDIYFLD